MDLNCFLRWAMWPMGLLFLELFVCINIWIYVMRLLITVTKSTWTGFYNNNVGSKLKAGVKPAKKFGFQFSMPTCILHWSFKKKKREETIPPPQLPDLRFRNKVCRITASVWFMLSQTWWSPVNFNILLLLFRYLSYHW